MKYKALVLDHDDTVVSSTAEIHFPCFVEYLRLTRPSLVEKWDVNTYFIKNFSPGITSILKDELQMNDEEVLRETEFWADYVKNHVPTAFRGIFEIISEFKRLGGIVAVNSHSLKKYIIRDYEANALPMPDYIYSWDLPEGIRKPSPYTVFDLMERFNLQKEDILVVDDLKPGYDMARAAGVDFAAAGWAYSIPEIEDFMKKNCDFYLKSTEELYSLLFAE